MTPGFSRAERLDTIGEVPRSLSIEAGPEELRRVAARFSLMSIERLTARFTLQRDASGITVAGRVDAALTQACSVTGDPVPATIDEPVSLRFVQGADHAEEEAELGGDVIDMIEIEGDSIDLGEAAAETMALALDPFPRAPGAEEVLKAAGVVPEDEVVPFNVFATLKNLKR